MPGAGAGARHLKPVFGRLVVGNCIVEDAEGRWSAGDCGLRMGGQGYSTIIRVVAHLVVLDHVGVCRTRIVTEKNTTRIIFDRVVGDSRMIDTG